MHSHLYEDNVWADLLGRWSAKLTVQRTVRFAPFVCSRDNEFSQPTKQELAEIQRKNNFLRPKKLKMDDEH